MDTATLEQATRALDYNALGAVEWRLQRAALEAPWREYLRVTHASDLTPAQAALVFDRAWEDGHSSGYAEVEYHYEALADLASQLIRLESARSASV